MVTSLYCWCFCFLGNHKGLAKSLKYDNILEYRYWDEASRSLDIEAMLEDLQVLPQRTGMDE